LEIDKDCIVWIFYYMRKENGLKSHQSPESRCERLAG
jgi:hypothetical protein